MSCNCNTANPNCEPCAICTPPGVTGLTTCEPIDPCEERPDIQCVTWNGPDHDCIDVQNGDSLLSVLIKILQVYFPQSYCCELDGYLNNYNCILAATAEVPLITTTTTTTTSTSSTTTTTTVAPECSFYEITNTNPNGSSVINYVDCCFRDSFETIVRSVTLCVSNISPITVESGSITTQNLGPCTQPCGPSTTTSTTTVPCVECELYDVVNNSGANYTLTFYECTNNGLILTQALIPNNTGVEICACPEVENHVYPQGFTITPRGVSCESQNITTSTTSTTSTTTSTSTTSTSSTTTTTTINCICHEIENTTGGILTYQFTNCETLMTDYGAVAGGAITLQCAVEKSIIAPAGTIINMLGACGSGDLECINTTSTTTSTTSTTSTSTTTTTLEPTTTTTTTASLCNCISFSNAGPDPQNVSWTTCTGGLVFPTSVPVGTNTLEVCGTNPVYDGPTGQVTWTIGGPCTQLGELYFCEGAVPECCTFEYSRIPDTSDPITIDYYDCNGFYQSLGFSAGEPASGSICLLNDSSLYSITGPVTGFFNCPCVPPGETTTTTTECVRPTGLTDVLLAYSVSNGSDPVWDFLNTSVSDACDAWNYYRTGSTGTSGAQQIQLATLALGERVYPVWSWTNCNNVIPGIYWWQNGTTDIDVYFRDPLLTSITIVTIGIVGGVSVITAIDTCDITTTSTTTSSTTTTTTLAPSMFQLTMRSETGFPFQGVFEYKIGPSGTWITGLCSQPLQPCPGPASPTCSFNIPSDTQLYVRLQLKTGVSATPYPVEFYIGDTGSPSDPCVSLPGTSYCEYNYPITTPGTYAITMLMRTNGGADPNGVACP